MHVFTGRLVPGDKPPYEGWTFLEIPADVDLGPSARVAVCGSAAGRPLRGNAHRSAGGLLRIVVSKAWMAEAGVGRGDVVEAELEVDADPPEPEVPPELQAMLDENPALEAAFTAMAPSHRRAWAGYVAEAKRPETRRERARKAAIAIPAKVWPR